MKPARQRPHKGFTVARDMRALLRAVIHVVDGLATWARQVQDGPWREEPRGTVAPPL
ncbi:hypothetical protein [Streptomyces sp. CNQ-509]|uniref:hypothetical protein n=1 Tax=Streptomyces sp. CNQ-509 TaxID=444103 RepID=UPI000AFAF118|nr:hypothetical protein [Streptomyces sp. CNQ-509]